MTGPSKDAFSGMAWRDTRERFFLWCRDVVVELIYYAWFHACDSSRPSSRSQLPSVHNAQTITSVS